MWRGCSVEECGIYMILYNAQRQMKRGTIKKLVTVILRESREWALTLYNAADFVMHFFFRMCKLAREPK